MGGSLLRNHSILRKFAAGFCALALLWSSAPVAHAGLVGTDEVLQQAQSAEQRAERVDMRERDDIRAELEELGVSADDAQKRVQRMTDAEVARLHGRVADARAGGVHGIVLTVFIVFVITDVIGATDIFPFIHPVD